MLRSLSVSNYILIGSLELEFPEGLVIISGETGAGKSILLGALSLVLGAKADADMVGPHGDNCVVEAEFTVDAALQKILQEKDISLDGDSLILRRVVSRSGRSRCFASDEPVAVGDLQEISALLVDIHSQHQTLKLQDPKFRIQALDLYAGCVDLREKTADALRRVNAARKELEELREKKALALRDQEYNHSRWQRLDQAKLVSGELEELDAEQKQLAHAEEIKETLYGVEELLSELHLKDASKLLDKASKFIPSLEELSSRMESARLELEDISATVEDLNARTEASPQRLQQVEDRISMLYSLLQKYGVASVEELIAERDRLGSLVQDLSTIDEQEAALEDAVRLAEKTWQALHTELVAKRRAAAEPFASAVQKQLKELELDRAIFQVQVGEDSVDFLSHAASGGELSRIMLSLKAIMARHTHMPTMIFDEIDTGVSGSAADKMGSLVCSMGASMQVFAITHLPQVAAKGSAHYLVSKKADETSVRLLDADGRVMEIARMLSGATITPEAILNAKSLLK